MKEKKEKVVRFEIDKKKYLDSSDVPIHMRERLYKESKSFLEQARKKKEEEYNKEKLLGKTLDKLAKSKFPKKKDKVFKKSKMGVVVPVSKYVEYYKRLFLYS